MLIPVTSRAAVSQLRWCVCCFSHTQTHVHQLNNTQGNSQSPIIVLISEQIQMCCVLGDDVPVVSFEAPFAS